MPVVIADTRPRAGFTKPGKRSAQSAAMLSGLGVWYDPTTWFSSASDAVTQFFNVNQRLLADNNALKSLEAAYAAAPDNFDPAIVAELNTTRDLYTSAVEKYLAAYTEVFGSEPSNANQLSGLGLGPVMLPVVTVAALAVIATILYEVEQHLATAQTIAQIGLSNANTKQQIAGQAVSLRQAAAVAAANGDQALADQLNAEADHADALAAGNPPGGSGTWSDWFQKNGMTLGVLAAGVFVLPSLLGAFTGRRR